MHTPWGDAQTIDAVGDGILDVTTASHGGIILDEKSTAAMPACMRSASFAGPSAYEEDCDWCMPALVFEQKFRAFYEGQRRSNIDAIFTRAKDMLRNCLPEVYEAFYSVTLKPGESSKRDEQQFYERNKNNWLTIAAYGDWHASVPKGMVAVAATIGGRRRAAGPERYFLIPASEYAAYPGDPKHRFAFVIDPSRFTEIRPLNP
jgi:hypothetical protein